jgi:hypothetical protein
VAYEVLAGNTADNTTLGGESVKFRGQNTIGWSDERSDTTFHLPAPGGS